MKKSSYKINDDFSPEEFNETDFGRIYFNTPSETREPKTIEELASTLKQYHRKGVPVTIRNTGHSVNGQTLTDGVQVRLGKLKKVYFDEKNLRVTVGAGTSWDELFKAIHFPKYCTPVFPHNPKQQIHVSGTAAVGGISPYSAKYGGFWNHVTDLKLVTMTGDIISCSPAENRDFFQFSLGGFGRIGVIGKLTVRVVLSKQYVLSISLGYHNATTYCQDFLAATKDFSDGLMGGEVYPPLISKLGISLDGLLLMYEVDENDDIAKMIDYVKKKYHEDIAVLAEEIPPGHTDFDITLRAKKISKEDMVYIYPIPKNEDQFDLCHPWSDFLVGKRNYPSFLKEVKRLINKYEMNKYLMKKTLMHGWLDVGILWTYVIKNLSTSSEKSFPLSLDLAQEDYNFGIGLDPTVPSPEVDKSINTVKELTDLVYELGGKTYLYGFHDLTKKQVEQQFGSDVIEKWQKIKDELDPKHLLNIGVIEHLDD